MISQQALRGEAARIAALAMEILVGLWLLCLFALALAWDPLDRRLGYHARRWAGRRGGAAHGWAQGEPRGRPRPPNAGPAGGAYAIVAAPGGDDADDEDAHSVYDAWRDIGATAPDREYPGGPRPGHYG